MSAGRRDGSQPRWAVAVAWLLGLVALACLIEPLARLGLHLPLDKNEGWNAYRAMAVALGQPLYPDADGLAPTNYPPLSFLLIGGLARWLGDPVVIGRAIAMTAMVVVALMVGRIVASKGGSALAGAPAALWLLAYETARAKPVYVGLDDPQWLGHALMVGGLALLLLRPRITIATLLAAEALMLAGGLVKHNLLPLPLAVTLWLLWRDRRLASVWLAAGVMLGGGAVLAAHLAFGPDFLRSVLGAEAGRVYRLRAVLVDGGRLVAPLLPAIALTAWAVVRGPRDPLHVLVALYAVLALAFGAYSLGGVGVDVNAFFDAEIALALGAGLGLADLLRDRRRAALGIALAGLSAVVLVGLPARLASLRAFEAGLADERLIADADIAFLRDRPGAAVCEEITLCFWAGKPPGVDLFTLDTRLRARTVAPEAVEAMLRERRFAVVQLDLWRLPGDGPNTIRSHLVPERQMPTWLAHLKPARWSAGRQPRVFLVPR